MSEHLQPGLPKTVTKKKLLELLDNISYPTLNKQLDKIKDLEHKGKRFFNPLETSLIFSHLGITP